MKNIFMKVTKSNDYSFSWFKVIIQQQKTGNYLPTLSCAFSMVAHVILSWRCWQIYLYVKSCTIRFGVILVLPSLSMLRKKLVIIRNRFVHAKSVW